MGSAQTGWRIVEDDVIKFRKNFESFLEATQDAREASELCRDFYDLKQWTTEEQMTLRARGQAPVVFDYIKDQVNHLVGMALNHYGDPAAYPRNRSDDGAASAATDALRYISDDNDFKENVYTSVAENLIVEGYGACITEIEKDGDGVSIVTREIPWDRFYYDPHSRRHDFSDAKFMGIVVWMDKSDAKRLYKDKAEDVDLYMSGDSGAEDETFEDRPKWIDRDRGRVRVCQHYYIKEGQWHTCHFTGSLSLIESEPVPFVDENGEPVCPIEAVSLYVDRDNDRYGYVKSLLDPQTEINKRRSKALFMLSARQVIAEDGAVKDEFEAKQELKKADGYVKVNPNMRFDVSPNMDLASGQIQLYQDAVNKADSVRASLMMADEVEGLSGKAVRQIQAGRSTQFGPLLMRLKNWRVRVYRQMWLRVRQFWTEEKWIRVTDDENNLQWVGLNKPLTYGEGLQKKAQEGDQRAAMALQQMVATQDPRLNQVAMVENQVAEMDVDIIIDESPDTLTIHQEQFEILAQLASSYPDKVPFEALLELSAIKGKDKVKELLAGQDNPMMAQMQQAIEQLQAQLQEVTQGMIAQKAQADNALTMAKVQTEQAKATKTAAEVTQTELENVLLAAFPDVQPNVII
jgi:hypothetical protein